MAWWRERRSVIGGLVVREEGVCCDAYAESREGTEQTAEEHLLFTQHSTGQDSVERQGTTLLSTQSPFRCATVN